MRSCVDVTVWPLGAVTVIVRVIGTAGPNRG
jgi:hypothetical protein